MNDRLILGVNMKKIRSAVLKTAIMLLVIFSIIIAANAGYSSLQQEKNEIQISGDGDRSEFYAEISIGVYGEDGCQDCEIPYAAVEAYGRDTDHFDTNITDLNGTCILELEYDATYRVTIEVEGYTLVMYDFKVLDDQPFAIHMQEEVEDSSTPHMSLIYTLFQRLRYLKN